MAGQLPQFLFFFFLFLSFCPEIPSEMVGKSYYSTTVTAYHFEEHTDKVLFGRLLCCQVRCALSLLRYADFILPQSLLHMQGGRMLLWPIHQISGSTIKMSPRPKELIHACPSKSMLRQDSLGTERDTPMMMAAKFRFEAGWQRA